MKLENIKILKKKGVIRNFREDKIRIAIGNAVADTGIEIDAIIINKIRLEILATIEQLEKETISTNEIDDIVVSILHSNKLFEVEKAYKKNSKRKAKIKLANTDLMKNIAKLGIMTDRDNANVGSNFSAKLLRISSESNKAYNLCNMKEKIAEAHENGDIYQHDLDSYNLTVNCLHVPTSKLLDQGFNTGYGPINPPKRISSAASLLCIMIQASQNDMFGGQSIPDFDNCLAPYVELTRQEISKEILKINSNITAKQLQELTNEKLIKEIRQAMQGICYNLNTMHSRAGSQVPFSSVNLGLPKSEDAALVCKLFLEEYNKGFAHGEQFIFPNIIFRVKQGVNRDKNDPYYFLFKLACKVAAKRMNPTFMNIDADFNKEYYDKGYVPATMGCVDGNERVIYKYNDTTFIVRFVTMWNKLSETFKVKEQEAKGNYYMDLTGVSIYDTLKGFVNCRRIIRNVSNDWLKISINNETLTCTADHPFHTMNRGRVLAEKLRIGDKVLISHSYHEPTKDTEQLAITKITQLDGPEYENKYSYDVTTDSDHFEVSRIYSYNCRTYLMKNVNGEPGVEGRGNIAPATINLPRIGILSEHSVAKFFELFEKKIELAKDSLLARYETLKKLKVRDLPFVAGEHLIKGSEGLTADDSIEPILKQGTWGIGFIGLAETLTAIIGSHHGETKEARDLGIRIITFLRDKCDEYTDKYQLNFSCYATPAEGLSGKFIQQDKLIFGEIVGVTDKDYYTNSFHIPVKFPISMIDKIKIEAPYHKLCNGGHISYIEIDNYPTPELVEELINYAYTQTNISYLGINFHIKYCKDCGSYLEAHESSCPKCGSKKIQGISRVTGYLSLDERFGVGKAAERADRCDHNAQHKKNY